MSQLVWIVLTVFCLVWLYYLFGARDRRFAFALWFPFAATSLLGTLLWLDLLYETCTTRFGSDAASGLGAAADVSGLIILVECPVILIVSLWQRPKTGAYGLTRILPVFALYISLFLFYRPVSELLENQKLELVVLDTKKAPLAHAKVSYKTHQEIFHSFPAAAMEGTVETGANGSVMLSIPKTHRFDCWVKLEGYPALSIGLVPEVGRVTWRRAEISWTLPTHNSKDSYTVKTDVGSSDMMHLIVFLPATSTETVPSYGFRKVPPWERQAKSSDDPSVWPRKPSVITRD